MDPKRQRRATSPIYAMAPKRQHRAVSSMYDTNRFVSPEAFDRYQQSLTKRRVMPERGFQVFFRTEPDIAKIIADRGWKDLVAQPGPAVVSLVREFYANAVERCDNEVYVRGKMVPFDSKTINAVYNLPDVANDDFSTLLETGMNMEVVISSLCQSGATWRKFRGAEVSFPAGVLTRNSKAWMRFIWTKLLPSTHTTDISRNKAILLYAIVCGKSIDVGKIIHGSIVRGARATTIMGLCLPSLICILCMRAGVFWAPCEEVQRPLPVINHEMIQKFADDEAVDTCIEDGSSSTQPPILSEMAAVFDKMTQIEARLDHLSNSIDRLTAYIANGNRAVANMPNQLDVNFGVGSMPFSSLLAQQQDYYPPVNHNDPSFPSGSSYFPSFP